MRIKELRMKAREDLSGSWMKLVIPITVIMSVMTVLELVMNTISNSTMSPLGKSVIGIAIFIFICFFSISTAFGIIITSAKIARKEETNFLKDTFADGIKLGFSCVWELIKKTYGWILLYVLGFILMFVGATAAMVLGTDTQSVIANGVTLTTLPMVYEYNPTSRIVGAICSFIGIVLVIWALIKLVVKSYDYFIANYLKNDYREKPTKELFIKSKELMYGNRCKVLLTPVTFLGWFLLTVLVMIIPIMIFQLIWPPYQSVLGTISTIPLWGDIILNILLSFIMSWVIAYMFMTYYEFYMEQNPLEIYNEGFEKAPTDKKYFKIALWLGIAVVSVYVILIAIAIK